MTTAEYSMTKEEHDALRYLQLVVAIECLTTSIIEPIAGILTILVVIILLAALIYWLSLDYWYDYIPETREYVRLVDRGIIFLKRFIYFSSQCNQKANDNDNTCQSNQDEQGDSDPKNLIGYREQQSDNRISTDNDTCEKQQPMYPSGRLSKSDNTEYQESSKNNKKNNFNHNCGHKQKSENKSPKQYKSSLQIIIHRFISFIAGNYNISSNQCLCGIYYLLEKLAGEVLCKSGYSIGQHYLELGLGYYPYFLISKRVVK